MEKNKKERIIFRIEEAKKEFPTHKEILDFYKKVFLFQEEIKGNDFPSLEIKKDIIDDKIKKGLPILSGKDTPTVDLGPVSPFFHKLLDLLKDENQLFKEQVPIIKEKINQNKEVLDYLFKALINGNNEIIDKRAKDFEINKEILYFLLTTFMKPYLEKITEATIEMIDENSWLRGYCPVCGHDPMFSELFGEEKRRYLFCSFCGARYHVMRIFCPFCENSEQKTVHYLMIEGDERYYIDVCDKCKRYLKGVNRKHFQTDFFPQVEFIVTLHLNLLAEKEGYKPASFSFLGI
ncbi:MAG: hypothetical protein DRG20_04520 [Deltaproteobacteria bacterium]|nr:MAG: hypothetical protein DRG20_04520 [Deltaproteobacteria bacterium]